MPLLARTLQARRRQFTVLVGLSPVVRRAVGGDEQDHHHVPLLPRW
jgi:hypothetical protein